MLLLREVEEDNDVDDVRHDFDDDDDDGNDDDDDCQIK